MQHWNSFSTLYTPFQSYFLPVNHILLVRVGKTGQYWWVIVYNSLCTHDVHQYKSFFILCYLKLNPYHRVTFKCSLREVSKEVNMWNPAFSRKGSKKNLRIQYHTLTWPRNHRYFGGLHRFQQQAGCPGMQRGDVWEQVKWPEGEEKRTCGEDNASITLHTELPGNHIVKTRRKSHIALESSSCRQLREEDYGSTFISFS